MQQFEKIYVCVFEGCQQSLVRESDVYSHLEVLKHKVIPLEDFNEKFKPILTETFVKKFLDVKLKIFETRERLIKEFTNQIDNLINQNLQDPEEIRGIQEIWGSNKQDEIKNIRQRIIKLWNEEPKQIMEADDLFSKDNILKVFENVIEQMEKLKPQQYSFSQELTNYHRIRGIRGDGTCIRGDGTLIVSLLNPPLQMNNIDQRVGFKWINGNDSVAFGVCHQQTVRDKKWYWNRRIGGGTYMITNEGLSYSNWEEQKNEKYGSFLFDHNIPVYCYFDGLRETVTFKNSQTNEQYQLKVQPNGEPLHFCVVICRNFIKVYPEVELIQPHRVPDL